jgi:NADH:ubiquinone oxidoreductase subunit E
MKKKDKILVKICVGTSCFVQGGADLLLYNDFLNPELLSKFEFEGCSCLGACKKIGDATGEEASAPFVMVNGKLHGNMNPEKLNKLLMEEV